MAKDIKHIHVFIIFFIFLNFESFSQNIKWDSADSLYYDLNRVPFTGVLIAPATADFPEIDSTVTVVEAGKIIIIRSYYKNGALKMEEHLIQGIRTQYYLNGKLFVLTRTSNKGKKDGEETIWYESGVIKAISNYKNDKKDGLTYNFHDNGKIESIINYVDNQVVGDERHWYKSGQLSYEHLNINIENKRQEIREYHENGALMSQWIILDAKKLNYNILRYNTNGKLIKEEIFKEGQIIEERIYDLNPKYKSVK